MKSRRWEDILVDAVEANLWVCEPVTKSRNRLKETMNFLEVLMFTIFANYDYLDYAKHSAKFDNVMLVKR